MKQKIDHVETYFIDGCGRCNYFGTPQCKIHNWEKELKKLRSIILETGLQEELKWSMPCYTFQGNNILILSAFKAYCSLNIFKGSLLQDEHKLLTQPTENTNAGRQFRFTNVKEIISQEDIIKAYIFEAIELEKIGAKVIPKKIVAQDFPEELQQFFLKNKLFKEAFYALTPGKQKGYLLHFSSAKQSQTKIARIEKCMPAIFEGKGFHDY